MDYLRRDFLIGLSVVAGTAFWHSSFPLWAQTAASADHYLLVGSGESALSVNLKSGLVQEVPIGFSPHSFIQNPLNPERVWAIEKWGSNAAEINFRQKKVIRRLESPTDTQFFGHGVFLPKADVIFIVNVDFKTGLGHLVGYDANHPEPVLNQQIAPGGLHDCRLLPDNTLLVASYGRRMMRADPKDKDRVPGFGERVEQPSLIHIDPQQWRVLDKKFIEDKEHSLAHFTVMKDGTIMVIGNPWPEYKSGAVFLGNVGKTSLERVVFPEAVESQLKGELLSVAVNEREHVAVVTNPHGGFILFIDTRTRKYLGKIERYFPRSVSFDSNLERFICGSEHALEAFDNKMQREKSFPIKFPADQGGGLFDGTHSLIVPMEDV